MKLSAKVFLLALMVAAVSICLAVVNRYSFVIPQLKELQAQADRKDVARVLTALDAKRSYVDQMTSDHGIWDQTFEFMQSRNQDFVEDNFTIETFLLNDLDLIIISDNQKNILWSGLADEERMAFVPGAEQLATELKPFIAESMRALSGAPIRTSGVVDSSFGPLMYGSVSIHRSDQSERALGSITMARRVNSELLEDIRDDLKMDIQQAELESVVYLPRKLDMHTRSKQDTIQWYLHDTYGKPVLAFTLNLGTPTFSDSLISSDMIAMLVAMLISFALVLLAMRWFLLAPLFRIVYHLREVRETDAYDMRLNASGSDELTELAQECDLLIGSIEKYRSDIERQAEVLEELSLHDSLTGLPNQRFFERYFYHQYQLAGETKTPLSVLVCNIDCFKRYNENYGQAVGNEALKTVGYSLKRTLLHDEDLVARLDGDNFAVLLPDTDDAGLRKVSKALHAVVDRANIAHDFSSCASHLTISIGGICFQAGDGLQLQDVMVAAENKLQRAKNQGRNQSVIGVLSSEH